MVRCCKICSLSKDDDVGSVLFKAPQQQKERSMWRNACGVFLTKNCLVCEKHFQPSDLIGKGKTTKLRDKALPTEFPYIDPELKLNEKTIAEDSSLPLIKKSKSSELVLFSEAVEVKVDPSSIINPLALINEEQFDNHPRTTATFSSDTIVKNSSLEARVLTCGSIDLKICGSDKCYTLKCNQCDEEIEIVNWKHFIDHCENTHQTNAEDLKLQYNSQIDSEEHGDYENLDNETQDSNLDSNNASQDDSDNYEPKQKLSKKEGNVISFGRSEKEKVLELLELTRSHPILWYRRQSVKKRYNEALTEVTKKFNQKFPKFQLDEERLHLSISRIKYLYQRLSDPKHKRHISDSTFKSKYSEYFKICDDIDAKSKTIEVKCELCGVSFLEEINLQVHSFYVHNIGELPFKCDRCERRFSRISKLNSHKKKHSDVTFNCEHCSRTFDQEQKLQYHLKMHDGCKQICEVCGKQFDNAYRYRRHKLHHEPPKEKCEICGKMLYEKYTLSEHMKSHQNERQYTCDICFKKFNRQQGLTIHKRSVHKITENVWENKRAAMWLSLKLFP